MAETILLVDDETDVLNLVRYNLSKAGYTVALASNGMDAIRFVLANRPDLVLLDIMMPGLDGWEVCRRLRGEKETRSIPILFLTAKGGQGDRIRGLETGADDYIAKPFSVKELILRVQAILRRVREGKSGSSIVEFEDLRIDRGALVAYLGGDRLDLTLTEFKLLSLLVERRGRVLSRDTLLSKVWGYSVTMDTRTIDTHMRRLRRKLGAHAERIETLRGSGYRFRATPGDGRR